ncbi:hypothetical protein BGZ63DRAFT_398319 [Mariannaea sp. PMI_226]|nr:hypothetical protein BGZ63DRAFT_398319 [Mariannaea sp. PMI_226]
MSTDRNSPNALIDSGSSSLASDRAQSDYDLSVFNDGRPRNSTSSVPRTNRVRPSKSRWFTQVKDWLSVSEPSAQAMKTQKEMTFKKHGIDFKDPQAAAKLHLPIGKLPKGAITSTSGPSPEKALKRAQQQQQQHKRQSYSTSSQGSHSMSSSIFSAPSAKEPNPVTPWED